MDSAYFATSWLREALRGVVIDSDVRVYRIGSPQAFGDGFALRWASQRYVVVGCTLANQVILALLASIDLVASFSNGGPVEAFPLESLCGGPRAHRAWEVTATWMQPGGLRHVVEKMRVAGELPVVKPTIEYRETWPDWPRRGESPIAGALRAWAPFARVRRSLAAASAAWNEGRSSEQ